MLSTIFKNKAHLIKELIKPSDTILDVGFWGQGKSINDANWPHQLLRNRAKRVDGLDLVFDRERLPSDGRYYLGSAEKFVGEELYDVVFAGDLIEHLPNPGLFLDAAAKNLKLGGRLIITTPNAFNLFNLAEKLTKYEPTVNPDHTVYFNTKTIRQLLEKCGWSVDRVAYIYSLELTHRESWKKSLLNIIYRVLCLRTDKFSETLVIVAKQ